jgi:hypothetical protein
MESRTPGLGRKACERCRKLRCKCDNNTPCASCAFQKSPCIRLIRKRPARQLDSKVKRHPTLLQRGTSVESLSSFDSALDLFFNQTSSPDMSLVRASFCQDQLLPDLNPLLHDLFDALNRPRPNDWSSISNCSLHRLLSTTSPIDLTRIDPLESHRLTITDHLSRSSQLQREDISWFTPTNLRRGLIAYFRHCHRHLPIIHLPTWDIASIPSSLVLVQVLLGSLYVSDPSTNALRARRILPDAFSLLFKLDEVHEISVVADLGVPK